MQEYSLVQALLRRVEAGRLICMILERAHIPYIAFERSFDRLDEAKKWKHKVHYGDVTDPAMMVGWPSHTPALWSSRRETIQQSNE